MSAPQTKLMIPAAVKRSVLKTLKYSDHFGFPLTLEEIHSRLIGVKTTQTILVRQLRQMLKAGSLAHSSDFFHLPGRSALISRRLSRALYSRALYSRALVLSRQLGRLPGVTAIYLTGSLAMSNIAKDSDIDFMVITNPGRLWTTRLLLTLYTTILGLRRTPKSKHHPGKLCLNLYLTLNSLTLPKTKRSLYTAYELVQAVPLYDPHHTHPQLLFANSWINQYLPNQPSGPGPASPNPSSGPGSTGTLLEYILYHLQLLYMHHKITREYITKDSAFFHPHNPAPKV